MNIGGTLVRFYFKVYPFLGVTEEGNYNKLSIIYLVHSEFITEMRKAKGNNIFYSTLDGSRIDSQGRYNSVAFN